MITDSNQAILARNTEEWTREILNFVEKYSDNMVGRKIVNVRNIGADVAVDVVQTFDKKGADALICAKGTVPSGTGSSVIETKHSIYQLLAGFDIHEKDLKLDPKLKNRNIDICMRRVHRAEDELVINGNTALNINGITDGIPTANQITVAGAGGTLANNGAWNGSEANDIYQDVLNAIGMLDTDFDAAWIAGNPVDINYVRGMDSERNPYWETLRGLFNATKPEDFLFKSNRFTAGTVIVGVKDPDAAELVIGENPKVTALPIQRGQMYPVEITAWETFEKHNTDCFASIATG